MAEMTPQKALKILEMFLHKQCDLQRTEFAYSQNEVYMAVSMAKYALEKPIQETTEQEKTLTLAFGKDGKARVLNEDYAIYCADKETFEKVKSAVEKQTPKKPTSHKVEGEKIKIGNGYWCKGTTVYKCPRCHCWISRVCKSCLDCGQALDWSDTE